MSVKIVTDSTCDLSNKLAIDDDKLLIVPLYINVGGQSFRDGVDLSREAFYRQLPTWNPPPTTAAPGPDLFRQAYLDLISAGATEILSIHVAAELSATVNNARLGAETITGAPVTVLDSRQLSLGAGLLVLTAAQAASSGMAVAEILPILQSQMERTHLFAALDTLEYLRRSGRVSPMMAGLGSMLQIKPLLKMHQGVPASERVRTRRRAIERLLELLAEVSPLEQAALIHSNAPEEAEALRQQAAHLLPPGELLSVEVTPVIGSHVGPGAVGFVAVSAG